MLVKTYFLRSAASRAGDRLAPLNQEAIKVCVCFGEHIKISYLKRPILLLRSEFCLYWQIELLAADRLGAG